MLGKDGDQSDRSCEKCRSITECQEKRNVLHTIKKRKAKWIGHMLCRNSLLKHAAEGKIEGDK